MARARSLLWIGAIAAIIYLLWRWRSQQIGEPGLLPGPSFPDISPPGLGAPPPAATGQVEQPPEPAAPPAAAAVAFRERAVGAATPIEAEPPEPEPTSQESPADADGVDLALLVGPEADAEGVDLAPLVGPAAALGDAGLAGPVNINIADLQALIALPGIGPALARRIIAYREQHGPFTSVDQLIDVQGIGRRNIDEFRHLVTV
jgi:competence protein ComEA